MEKNELETKVNNAIKVFEGISGTLNGLLQPPADLVADKRAAVVCLGVGTVGVAFLSWMEAPWYAFVVEGCLVCVTAFLVTRKRGKNG